MISGSMELLLQANAVHEVPFSFFPNIAVAFSELMYLAKGINPIARNSLFLFQAHRFVSQVGLFVILILLF